MPTTQRVQALDNEDDEVFPMKVAAVESDDLQLVKSLPTTLDSKQILGHNAMLFLSKCTNKQQVTLA